MGLIGRPYLGSPREVLVKSRTLLQNYEQFIESNTDHCWSVDYLKNVMSGNTGTLAISSYKIADQSELISHTLASGLWRLLKYTIKPRMIYSHVVTCTW